MVEDFDLVEYPFAVEDSGKLYLQKRRESYEARITNALDSKKIFATKKKLKRVYLHVSIGDGDCTLVGASGSIHQFISPSDYYIPSEGESRSFYYDMYKRFISDNNDSYLEHFSDLSNLKDIPLFPPPLFTVADVYDNLPVQRNQKKRGIERCLKVKLGGQVPNVPSKDYVEEMKSKHDINVYNEAVDILKKMFEISPIIRLSIVERKYDDENQNLKFITLKPFFPLVAYYMVSGPWKRCWVRLGFDPTQNVECYKYQVVYYKNLSKEFVIADEMEVVREIESDRDKYLNRECTPRTGFLSEKCMAYLRYYKSKKNDEILEEGSLDFDVFD
jgi:general transcription factor 3C polypeptide 5 (transcription factor C subunit 1)